MIMKIYLKFGSSGKMVEQLQKALSLIPDGIFGRLTEEAVKEFQRQKGLTVDGIVGAATWAALFPQMVFKKSARRITEVIVHCSATPEGKDYTVDDITAWHKARGFNTIGYHYVIYRDGGIYLGRDVDKVGAHCTGHNSNSIGICYIGGCDKTGKKPKDTRTAAQKESLIKLLKYMKQMYPGIEIYGHRNYANKACPSFDARKEYKNL